MAKRATGGSPRDPTPGGRAGTPSRRGVCRPPAPGVKPSAAPGPSCAVSCPPNAVVEVGCRRGSAWQAVGPSPGVAWRSRRRHARRWSGAARPRESPWASQRVPSPAPPHQAGGTEPAGRRGGAGRGSGRAAPDTPTGCHPPPCQSGRGGVIPHGVPPAPAWGGGLACLRPWAAKGPGGASSEASGRVLGPARRVRTPRRGSGQARGKA